MKQNIDEINNEAWEKICTRCGQCCHNKFRLKNIVIVDPTSTCKHLKNNMCTIYENRLKPGECMHIKEALKIDFMLPTSCPYVKLKPGYKGFVMPSPETFEQTIFVFALIEDEEKRLGRQMTDKEIYNFKITQEKIDAFYERAK